MWDKGKEGTWNSPPSYQKPCSFHNRATVLNVFLKDSSEDTLTWKYVKLADIEQVEKETPGKFLDRLWETLHKFTDVDPESAWEEWS